MGADRSKTKENVGETLQILTFNFLKVWEEKYTSEKFICDDCENNCNVVQIKEGEKTLAFWGDRCGKWANFDKLTSE